MKRKINIGILAHVDAGKTSLTEQLLFCGGAHHHVHTHPLDFFVCTPMAIMDGLKNCGTTLLEPILRVRAVFDPALAGRVIGLLQGMRGVLLEQVVRGEKQVLNAEVPAAESMELPVEFAKLTGADASVVALPSWLSRETGTLKGVVTKLPERSDIDYDVQEHLIVELYSK